jgi:pimeloyl-ACP methyl ester carboxylesterase
MTTALPDFEASYAEINEAKIYYEIAGSGIPLILVHGFSLDRRMWDDQFAFLATEYRVIRYDVRGFGNSTDVPVQPYSYPDDLMRLMDHIGIEAAHLVGLSMGGRHRGRFRSRTS